MTSEVVGFWLPILYRSEDAEAPKRVAANDANDANQETRVEFVRGARLQRSKRSQR